MSIEPEIASVVTADSDILPFPWEESAGTAAALGDEFLGSLLREPWLRDLVKDAVKVLRRKEGRPDVPVTRTDPKQLGSALLELLDSREGRLILRTKWDRETPRIFARRQHKPLWRQFLAERIFETSQTHQPPATVYRWEAERQYLDIGGLEQWLASAKVVDDLVLVRWAAAFALIQADESLRIARSVLSLRADARAYIFANRVSAVPRPQPSTAPQVDDPSDRETHVAHRPTVAAATGSSRLQVTAAPLHRSPEPLDTRQREPRYRLLAAETKWKSDLPLSVVREAVRSLQGTLEACEESLRDIDSREKRVGEALRSASKLPWFSPPLIIARLVARDGETVDDFAARVKSAEAGLSSLFRAHEELSALTSAGGGSPAVILRGGEMTVDTATLGLDRMIRTLSVELEDRRRDEQLATSWLESLPVIAHDDAATHLFETDFTQWAAIARLVIADHPLSQSGRTFRSLLTPHREVGAGLVSILVCSDIGRAAQFLESTLRNGLAETKIGEDLLGCLTDTQIRDLGVANPRLAPLAARLLFSRGVERGDTAPIALLRPLIATSLQEPICRRFFDTVVDSIPRVGIDGFMASLRSHDTRSGASMPRPAIRAKAELLEYLTSDPGMSGNYHRLRVIASRKFFAPLVSLVASDRPDEALSVWAKHGTTEEMLRACLDDPGARDRIDTTHERQTASYLSKCGEKLREWSRLSRESSGRPHAAHRLDAVITDVRASTGSQARAIVRVIETLLQGRDAQRTPLPARIDMLGDGRAVVVDSASVLDPCMTWAWPRRNDDGSVDALWWLGDLLRRSLGHLPSTHADAVEVYLGRSDLKSARAAAGLDPELLERVERVKRDLGLRMLEPYNSLLTECAEIQEEAPEVAACLEIFKGEVDRLSINDVESAAKLLSEALERHRFDRDPQRRALLDFAVAAGDSPPRDEPLQDLIERANRIRRANSDRRMHIDAMLALIEKQVVPAELVQRWEQAIVAFDHPRRWPSDLRSLEIEHAIGKTERWVRGQTRDLAEPAAQARKLRLFDGLTSLVESALPSESAAETSERPLLLRIADDIDSYGPAERVWQLLGQAEPPLRAVSTTTHDVHVEPASSGSVRPGPARHEIKRSSVLRDIRHRLVAHSSAVEPDPSADRAALEMAIRQNDWGRATALGAALHTNETTGIEARFSWTEAMFATASALSADLRTTKGAQLLSDATLALLHTHSTPSADLKREVFIRAVVAIEPGSVAVGSERVGANVLADALRAIVESGEASRRLADLFEAASTLVDRENASTELAVALWEVFTNVKESPAHRANLLLLLFRARRFEALRKLAHSARDAEDMLVMALGAFERAESDPEVVSTCRQVADALAEQAKGPNTRPWVLMFQRLLQQDVDPGDVPPVTVILDSEWVEEVSADLVRIELHLVPSPLDRPTSLTLEFATPPGMAPLRKQLLDSTLLLKETTVSIEIPRSVFGADGSVTQLPYRLTGRTLLDKRFDTRGAFTLQTDRMARAEPLSAETLRTCWPGAGGDPVTRAFYGRNAEISEIRNSLDAADRQRSVMVFGQRRIGKTSLLLQLVSELPPAPHRAAGMFVDVSALNTEAPSLARALFTRIVKALDNDPPNEALRRALRRNRDFETLARGIAPEESLFYALEQLLTRIEEATEPKITRLVICIDEFDRFIEPLLGGKEEPVNLLMWDIRQIVQRSSRISLVLAGSGLQRLLVDDYKAPLFGSIDQVEILPFRFDSDRDAIQKTFLPAEVRHSLARAGAVETLVRRAYELSGGHPYYLSMMGFSAAQFMRGRPLTPPSLGRVVEAMIEGKIEGTSARINSGRFYQPIFDTLVRLTRRASGIARLLLTHVARRTTADWPHVSVLEAMQCPDLTGATDRERTEALKALQREGAIDLDPGRDGGRLRIRVPLTAAALRADADEIRRDALIDLQYGYPE